MHWFALYSGLAMAASHSLQLLPSDTFHYYVINGLRRCLKSVNGHILQVSEFHCELMPNNAELFWK